MNSKAMGLSLAMAGLAAFFVITSVSSIEEETKKKYGDEVTVLVAKSDIKEMDTISASQFEPKSIPKNYVEPNAIRFDELIKEDSKEYSMETKRYIGQVAVVTIKKGEQLSLNKITEPNMRTGLSPQVTPGKRAMAVSVDETSSVSKLLKPGDRIDVIAVLDMGGNAQKVAKTILQDVVILAVGRNITNNLARKVDVEMASGREKVRSLTEFDGYNSITLELDPGQAQLIASIVGGAANRLIFTLRNNDDADRATLNAVRASDALNEIRAPASGGARQ